MVLPAFFTAIPAATSQLFGDDAIISITFRTAIIQEMKYLDYYDNPNNYCMELYHYKVLNKYSNSKVSSNIETFKHSLLSLNEILNYLSTI